MKGRFRWGGGVKALDPRLVLQFSTTPELLAGVATLAVDGKLREASGSVGVRYDQRDAPPLTAANRSTAAEVDCAFLPTENDPAPEVEAFLYPSDLAPPALEEIWSWDPRPKARTRGASRPAYIGFERYGEDGDDVGLAHARTGGDQRLTAASTVWPRGAGGRRPAGGPGGVDQKRGRHRQRFRTGRRWNRSLIAGVRIQYMLSKRLRVGRDRARVWPFGWGAAEVTPSIAPRPTGEPCPLCLTSETSRGALAERRWAPPARLRYACSRSSWRPREPNRPSPRSRGG